MIADAEGWYRDLGPGRAARNGRLLPNAERPRPPRDGAWQRRLEEIRAEREALTRDE